MAVVIDYATGIVETYLPNWAPAIKSVTSTLSMLILRILS
jgi:hypothetical protein